ncbi:GNAT family N-acetyltransferase [Vibrio diazotrophicus]|uniref:GNAT family N-acetyltransferase n=1 Tax=Vibrio diazotrophicus TaxID=685 RepID=UPI0005A5D64C|nr:GNAT family N-acetyltransferase [Vibrio diazotrophicus]
MITIRDYREEDAPTLWAIHHYTIRNINVRDYSQAQIEAWAPDNFDLHVWQKRVDALNPFIATIDGVIVGYTDLQLDGLIDHFFCHHEFQGRGVGKALMNHVFNVGKQKDIKRFYSHVSITARPFYERMGFSVAKEQLMEVRGQKLKNFLMIKNID